jgi:UDP-3-O-[3-hydroxymyristoyl] glucosamine N-acyltransferase
MSMKFNEVIEKLGEGLITASSLTSHPNINPILKGVASVEEATPDTLSYIEGEKFAKWVVTTNARALILPMDEALQAEATAREVAWMATPQPRLVFAQVLDLFYQPFRPKPGIHASAVIDSSVQLGQDVHIGANVVIEAGVSIEDSACIFPNVVIYPEVEVGEGTILHANCTIHERTLIGANCIIHSGAVIGDEGFGFVRVPDGWYKMQQSGRVVLEEGVDIGCNTTIDRPAVGETRIKRNTKIDNLVQIGHGSTVGENCAIASQAGMAGGVTVGNRVILAGQVGIANEAKIGDGAIATAKAGIHHDVEAGEIVSGIPALPHKLFLRVAAVYSRLPEMYKILRKLQKP